MPYGPKLIRINVTTAGKKMDSIRLKHRKEEKKNNLKRKLKKFV